MSLLSNNKKRQVADYAMVLIGGILLKVVLKINIFAAIGIMYAVFVVVDLLMVLLADLVVPLMFVRVYPKKQSELKHSNKQYQYILEVDGKEKYSTVYDRPLSGVEIRCYKNFGKYFFQVRKSTTISETSSHR